MKKSSVVQKNKYPSLEDLLFSTFPIIWLFLFKRTCKLKFKSYYFRLFDPVQWNTLLWSSAIHHQVKK